MVRRGRKSKYDTVIKPRFDEILNWLQDGATEQQVAQNLGIAYSTFNKWKSEETELMEVCKKGRQALVLQLRGALIKKAMGYKYTEIKTVSEAIKLPDDMQQFLLDNGFTQKEIAQARLVKTEVAEKEQTPDVAALNLALKNYDKANWANDPQMLDIKKEELKLKKKVIEEGGGW